MSKRINHLTYNIYRMVFKGHRAVKGIGQQRRIRMNKNDAENETEKEYYGKIIALMPQIGQYKKSTILHLRNRARECGYDSLKDYYVFLKENEEEKDYLRTHLTLQGTYFFRGDDWPAFSEKCLTAFTGREKVRIWCAGCSTGQEVYSLILCLLEYTDISSLDVLATDYDDDVLKMCRDGVYAIWNLEQIPKKYHGFIEKSPNQFLKRNRFRDNFKSYFTFKEDIKKCIKTENIDLLTDKYPTGYDIVLCRNVIKFFDPDVIKKVQEKLSAVLNPGGFLFLSTDGEGNDKELIKEPEKLGLIQIDGRCIYQKL